PSAGKHEDQWAVTECARCHGDAEGGPASRLVPVLAGQSGPYLARALAEYAAGTRQSGIMRPVAHALDAGRIDALAEHYGLMRRPGPAAVAPPDAAATADIERGRRIATDGLPEAGVPPCLACHSGDTTPLFPL